MEYKAIKRGEIYVCGTPTCGHAGASPTTLEDVKNGVTAFLCTNCRRWNSIPILEQVVPPVIQQKLDDYEAMYC